MTIRRYCSNCKTWFDSDGKEVINCPNCERQIRTAKCLRCGHEWNLRFAEYPTICAGRKCRSPYYNTTRTKSFGKIRYVEGQEKKEGMTDDREIQANA